MDVSPDFLQADLRICVLHYSTTYSGNAEADVIAKILDKMKTKSDKYGRPVTHAGNTVNVFFSISPIHVLEFDEKNQVLTTMIWWNMVC